jgi:hypothetical protein
MYERIPWTGGISNRQILIDSVRGVTTWMSVAISLSVLVWLATDSIHFANPNWRASICAAVAAAVAVPIARWCRGHNP